MIKYLVPVIHVVILFTIAFLYRRKYRNEPLVGYFLPGLALKCLAGTVLGAIYFIYYQQGDTIAYHEEAETMANAAISSTSEYLSVIFFNDSSTELWSEISFTNQARALLMVKILSVVHLLTSGNYWISGIYFSYFSFISLFFLANKLVVYFPWTRLGAIIGFLFFPSVVFWSSGINKETITTGIVAICVGWAVPLFAQRQGLRLSQIITGSFLMLVLWKLKYYYAGVFIPVFLSSLMVAYLRVEYSGIASDIRKQVLYWFSFFVLTIIVTSFIHPNLRLDNFLEVIVDNYHKMIAISDPGDVFVFKDLDAGIVSFIKNAPIALYNGLFKPLPWEVDGVLKMIHASENFVLMLLVIFGLPAIGYLNKGNVGYLVVAVIVYILLLSTLLAFSTPNYGTLARYNTSFMPFLVYILLADPPLGYVYRKFTLAMGS